MGPAHPSISFVFFMFAKTLFYRNKASQPPSLLKKYFTNPSISLLTNVPTAPSVRNGEKLFPFFLGGECSGKERSVDMNNHFDRDGC